MIVELRVDFFVHENLDNCLFQGGLVVVDSDNMEIQEGVHR